MFLMWYDDDKRKSVAAKIAEALAHYQRRFEQPANVVIGHVGIEAQADVPRGVTLIGAQRVLPNNLQIGRDDGRA